MAAGSQSPPAGKRGRSLHFSFAKYDRVCPGDRFLWLVSGITIPVREGHPGQIHSAQSVSIKALPAKRTIARKVRSSQFLLTGLALPDSPALVDFDLGHCGFHENLFRRIGSHA